MQYFFAIIVFKKQQTQSLPPPLKVTPRSNNNINWSIHIIKEVHNIPIKKNSPATRYGYSHDVPKTAWHHYSPPTPP